MSKENEELHQNVDEKVSQEPAFMQEVRKLIAQGNKLMAIKVYVDNTRCDLKTAKDKIDSMA